MALNVDIEGLVKVVMSCAYKVREALTAGYSEKIYENAMLIEMRHAGLNVRNQVPIIVRYKGHAVGEYIADVVVEDSLIVELKAVETLLTVHEVQLVSYLTATGIDDGLLINFGNSERLQIKRKFRTYRPKSTSRKNV